MRTGFVLILLCLALLLAVPATAGQDLPDQADSFLIRVERITRNDLSDLLSGGVPVVMEMLNCLFVEGNLEDIQWLDNNGYSSTILHDDPETSDYLVVGSRPDSEMDAIQALGKILHQEENWILVRVEKDASFESLAAARMFVTKMPHETMHPPKEVEQRFKKTDSALTEGFGPADPLVQKIVDNIDTADIQQFWQDLTSNPPTGTRYSTHQGCRDAADYCYNLYTSLGLFSEYHNWNPSYAPNVIATQEGAIYPDHVYIIEGHLDDLPSSPPAPGADDNASGSVTSLEAAYAMSCWAYKSTVKYMVVTGEEQGLLGSKAYANRAQSEGENILGVINMDMNGWEGNGIPTPENLDINYNGPSQWLGELFDECSQKYNTGLVVDDFYCPSLSASDHYPFWQKGWHAICGITDNEGYCGHGGNYPYYHQSDDTIANCGDPSLFYGAVKTSVATLAEMAEPFKIAMSKPFFSCESGITVVVGDRDLNTNPGLQETIDVEVWSDTESTPELLTLTERNLDSMIFDSTIPTTPDPPVADDGIISVSPGDAVNARYVDDLDCDGSTGVTYTDTSHIDCIKPLISNVSEQNITDTSATITWNTDEDSSTVLRWGEVIPPSETSVVTGMTTTHSVSLSDLQECTVYYYSVESEDIAGNIALDDNAGTYYYFETYGNFPEVGVVPCHAGQINLDTDIYSCSDTVTATVTDIDLNQDSQVVETIEVTLTSSTEIDEETLILTETGPNTSQFRGSITTASGSPASDGILQAANGDNVTATYHDVDDGAGNLRVTSASAVTDCNGPVISDIRIEEITNTRVEVTWTTDEPATSRVDFGSTPGLGSSEEESALVTNHRIAISPFESCELHYFEVTSVDVYGNQAEASSPDGPFVFNTWDIPGLFFRDGFETDLGWSLNGDWERGAPQGLGGSSGYADPSQSWSGDFVIGTDLSGQGSYPGDYEPNTSTSAMMPILDASDFTNSKLIIRRKLGVENDDNSSIRINKGFWVTIWANHSQTINEVDYTYQSYDISENADGDPSLQLAFSMVSDATTQYAGWTLDEVIIKDGSLPDYEACSGCSGAPSFSGLAIAQDIDACASGGIHLSWEPAAAWGTGSGGTYAVYRSTAPGFEPGPTNLIVSGLSGTSHDDTGAPESVDLYYIVQAENDETCSGGPNNNGMQDDNHVERMARNDISQPPPGSISTLNVRSVNDANIRLEWDQVSSAATYRIYRGEQPDMSDAYLMEETTVTFYEDMHEKLNNKSYYYRVQGANACGQE
jgi:hypothetical protein